MEPVVENIHKIYEEIRSIELESGSNDAKANSLRKIYERFIKLALSIPENTRLPNLSEAIDRYIAREKKYGLQSVCRQLCRDLNKWSHDTPEKLLANELADLAMRLKNIVHGITGIPFEKYDMNQEPFSLSGLKLDEKQKVAVLSTERITLVTAGPGTGKTRILVGRILYELSIQASSKIAGISFTNTAADELREKITTQIFSTNLSEYRGNVISGTIHSFALRMLQDYHESTGKQFEYIIIDDAEEKEILALFNRDKNAISKYCAENKILTFDRIIQLFNETTKHTTEFCDFLIKQVNEIVIDEAQDLNKEQYEMLSLMYSNNPELKLFFVADQRQNIYGFREGSLRVNEIFGADNVYNVDLEKSYRCPQRILDFINKFQFQDCRNVPLSNAWGIEGSPLTLRSFEDKEQEADWISHSLNEKKISGAALLDSAIIFTNTFYFEEILNALNKNEISFRVFGGTYFLDVNIKLFNALLTFINTENLYALQSILHQCGEYSLRVKTINQVLKIIDGPEKNKNINTKAMECLLFAIKHCEEKRLPLEILEDFAQLASDKQILDQEGLSACQHLKEIICNDLILNDYNELKFSIAPKHPELGKFYRRSDEIVPCSNKDDTDYVTVTTVHSAKGLQWDTVYLPGLYQGGVPRWFPDSKTEQRQLPEELKKFYVSCTRAQKNLYLTRPKKVTIKSKKDGCKHTFDKPISMFVNNLSVQNGRL